VKNRNLALPNMTWIFSVLLAFVPFSSRAGEMVPILRYAAIFARGVNPEPSTWVPPGTYPTASDWRYGHVWPRLRRTPENVALSMPLESGELPPRETEISRSKRSVLGASANPSGMPGQCDVSSPSFASADTLVTRHASAPLIPFQLTEGLIYMQASLNGCSPLWMILDTGSSYTVIDASVSKLLGLDLLGEGIAYGPGQGATQKFAFARHTTLTFAGAELSDQTVATLPLGWFSRELGRRVDGFLGSNIFQTYVVEIDYDEQLLRFYDPASYSYSGSGEHLPLEFVWKNIPSVRAEVLTRDGTAIQGIFLVDSGATTAIWLSRTFSNTHPEFLSAEETIEVPNVVAVGGEFSARLGRVPAVRLGKFLVSMPLAQFSQNSSGIFATPGLAGTIGAETLRRFTVIFDYSHREMILEPNKHFSDPST
jgi:Aspartyl protease